MQIKICENDIARFSAVNIGFENGTMVVDFEDKATKVMPAAPVWVNGQMPLKNLDGLTWQQISEIEKSGKAKERFALGATKEGLHEKRLRCRVENHRFRP